VIVRAQAEDESTEDYELTLYRQDANASLLQIDCQPTLGELGPLRPNEYAPVQLDIQAPPRTPSLSCVLTPASTSASLHVCSYGNSSAVPLADPVCLPLLAGELSLPLLLIGVGRTLVEFRVTADDTTLQRSFFVRTYVPSDDWRLAALGLRLNGTALPLVPTFSSERLRYWVFVSQNDSHWLAELSAVPVQPSTELFLALNETWHPLSSVPPTVPVVVGSTLQLRARSEWGPADDYFVTVASRSHVRLFCPGARNLSQLLPVGFVSDTRHWCEVQTPSGRPPLGGNVSLSIDFRSANGELLPGSTVIDALNGTAAPWGNVSFGAPPASSGDHFTVRFALSGPAAHQYVVPDEAVFALLDTSLLSMQVAGLSAAGVPAAPVAVMPTLHASVRNFSCVLGETYPSLRLSFNLQPVDELRVWHEGDALAAQQAQHQSWPSSSLAVRMLPGYNRLTLYWELIGRYQLDIWNGAEIVPPRVRLMLPDPPSGLLFVVRGVSLRLQAQLQFIDSRTALSDLTFEWRSPSHPELQLSGRPLNNSSGSGSGRANINGSSSLTVNAASSTTRHLLASSNASELWLDGSALAALGSYTFAVRVIDSHPGHRTVDKKLAMGEATISFNALTSRSMAALGCEFIRDSSGQCAPCPEGAYCPGDGRMWPVPGYWSMDEWTAPTRCRVAEACPGVDLTVALRPGPNGTVLPIETDIDTTPCAEGYMGRSCVQCEAGFYQLDGGSCFPCGSHTDQTRELALAALVSVCVMLVLAGAVAFLSAAHLAQWFQLFCVLQDLAVVGADGAKSAPMFRAQLVTAFRYISLVNFDIEVLKPGCAGMPQLTFVYKFYFTLVAVLFTAALFALAALLRTALFLWKERQRLRQAQPAETAKQAAGDAQNREVVTPNDGSGPEQTSLPRRWCARFCCCAQRAAFAFHVPTPQRETAWMGFRRRLQHAIIILFCIFYLRICVLQLKTFRCEMAPVPDPLSLPGEFLADHEQRLFISEDLQTECYTGAHLQLVIVVSLLFAVYTLGLPLICVVVLMREMGEPSTDGVIGWLWRNVSWLRAPKYKRLEAHAVYSVASHAAPEQTPQRTGGTASKSAPASAAVGPVRGATGRTSSPATKQAVQLSSLAKKPLTRADKRFTVMRVATGISTARAESWGFLYLAFRPSHFCAMSLVLAMQVAFALVNVLASDAEPMRKLFLSGLLMSVQSMAIAVELPFRTWKDNFRHVLISLASMMHTALLVLTHVDGGRSPYFITLVLLFVLATLMLVLRDYIVCAKPTATLLPAEAARFPIPQWRRAAQQQPAVPAKQPPQLREDSSEDEKDTDQEHVLNGLEEKHEDQPVVVHLPPQQAMSSREPSASRPVNLQAIEPANDAAAATDPSTAANVQAHATPPWKSLFSIRPTTSNGVPHSFRLLPPRCWTASVT